MPLFLATNSLKAKMSVFQEASKINAEVKGPI